jgi:hypothetical protein
MFKKLILLALLSIALSETVQELNSEFQNDAIFAHNLYRKIHGVPPLVLNPKLSQLALRRATELANAGELNVKQNTFEGSSLGETVGSVGGFSHYNGISATQLWYSVVSKFDEEGELSSEGASFTQIVWKKTRQVGFGIAKSKSGKFFFVGEYFPSGNIRHQYEDNVFQLTDEEILKVGKQCAEAKSGEIWKKLLNKTATAVEKPEIVEKTPVDDVVAVETTASPIKLDRLLKTTKALKAKPATTVRITTKPATTTVLTTTIEEVEVPVTKKPIKITTTTVADEIIKTTPVPVEVEVIKTTRVPVRTTTVVDSPDLITVDDIIPETTTPIIKKAKTTTIAPVEVESTTEHVVKAVVAEETTTVLPKTTIKTTTVASEVEVTTKVVKTTTPVEVKTTKIVPVEEVVDVTTHKVVPTTIASEVEVDVTTKVVKTTTVPLLVKTTTLLPIENDEVVDVTTHRVVTTVVPVVEKTTKHIEPVETTVEHVVVEKTTVKPIEHVEHVEKTTVVAEHEVTTEKVVEKVVEKEVTTTPVVVVEEVEKTTIIIPIKAKKNLSKSKSSEREARKTSTKQTQE